MTKDFNVSCLENIKQDFQNTVREYNKMKNWISKKIIWKKLKLALMILFNILAIKKLQEIVKDLGLG